jgi:5-methyltetrahydrofolate--homocysteine methyltransferase
MEKADEKGKGTIVIATVKGDVHDIGKNLVDIILSNNGYTVYNLGIKQPINNIIDAAEKHEADAIGMSGLLVKSTVIMRDNLAVLNERNITTPVILGGAALTRKYVEQDLRPEYNGALFYAKDAFAGLKLMDSIMASEPQTPALDTPRDALRNRREAAMGEAHAASQGSVPADSQFAESPAFSSDTAETSPPFSADGLMDRPRLDLHDEAAERFGYTPPQSDITRDEPIPKPPFWGSRVIEHIDPRAAAAYLNENMIFQVQWGYRKNRRSPEDFRKYIDLEVRPILRDLLETCARDDILKPQAIYGFWPVQSDGDALIVYEPDNREREITRFDFPRQRKAPYWCLSDFFRSVSSGQHDVAAFMIVTVGRRVSDVARQWFAADHYKDYLHLHGLGVEMAEALAEYIHKQIRVEWGIAGMDARERQEIFKQRYQGSRYSFGYPACPRLEDQVKLWPLLKPGRIGVELSEEFQLEPEQSTTALVVHHKQAKYFNVR